MIKDTDVSVVLAGPCTPLLDRAVAAVRRFLPGSELVLSTWRGTVPSGIDVDVVVENDDPGTHDPGVPIQGLSARGMNTNRMLRSAREGIRRATRSHVLKLRTDAVLDGTGFLDWWRVPLPRGEALRVFDAHVLTISVATRPSDRAASMLFHPSDCAHFGLRSDLLRLWGGAEVDEAANVGWQRIAGPSGPAAVPALWNEQLVWLGALAATGYSVDYPHFGYAGPYAVSSSDAALVNNFLVLEPWQFGVRLPKLQEVFEASPLAGYTWLDDWRRLAAHASTIPAGAA